MSQILSPSEWGAKVNYDLWTDTYTPDDKVIWHYGGGAPNGYDTGKAREMEILRSYEAFHLSKGWRGLAYGWAVGASGTAYRARGWNSYGAHAGDLDDDGIPENTEGIPILFIVGGDQVPTDAQFEAAEYLVTEIFEPFVGKKLPVYGHQEVAQLGSGTATSCPGSPIMAHIQSLPERLILKEEDDDMFVLKTDPDSRSKNWKIEWWKRILIEIDPTLKGSLDAAASGVPWGEWSTGFINAIKKHGAPASGQGIGPGEAFRIKQKHWAQFGADVEDPDLSAYLKTTEAEQTFLKKSSRVRLKPE